MKRLVLIIDTDEAFATMVQQVLSEGMTFLAATATSGKGALRLAAHRAFDLVIIDTTLADIPLADLVTGLRVHNPNTRIMLIPSFGIDFGKLAAKLDIQGILPKPFFIPELEPMLKDALERQVRYAPPASGVSASFPRSNLTALATERPMPVATPTLAPTPAPQVAPAVAMRVDTPPVPAQTSESEMPWLNDVNKAARYLTGLTLGSSAEASMLTKGSVLYAYAGQFPREEAQELAELAHSNWVNSNKSGALVRFITLSNGTDYLLYSTPATGELLLSMVFSPETPLSMIRKQAGDVVRQLLTKPSDTGEIPKANPAPPTPPPTEKPSSRSFSGYSQPVRISRGNTGRQPAIATPEPELPTNPRPTETIQAEAFPLPGVYRTPHSLYTLSYTFLWLPKMPDVQLRGDMVEMLGKWMRQLALAYDWRVEELDIQPRYLQLVVACSPADAPEHVVKVMMQTTSKQILDEFPRLRELHPAGNFWTPGYLVTAPGHLLAKEKIEAFILYQRKEQGLVS
ncbi:MAG TPA: IS200/IS605 family transposase [Anaerolineales bacterium]|nr:IS200/IS605 family transposase [Anaerolineales bacterium]